MKTLLKFSPSLVRPRSILFFVLLLIGNSCNQQIESIPQTSPVNLQPDGYNYEQVGQFVYHSLRFGRGSVDPLSYLPQSNRKQILLDFEAAKRQYLKGTYEETMAALATQKQMKPLLVETLINYHNGLKEALSRFIPFSQLWDWLRQQEQAVLANASFNRDEKERITAEMASIRYYLKYTLENNEDYAALVMSGINKGTGARIQLPCWLNTVFCYLENVALVFGLAAVFIDPPIGAVLVVSLTAGGGVIGLLRCNCDGSVSVCKRPGWISAQSSCYDPNQGLTLYTGDYGNTNPSIQWDIDLNADGTIDFFSLGAGDQVTLSAAQLGGATAIRVRSDANCEGTYVYSDWSSTYSLSQLGSPYLFLSGPSYMANSGSVVTYNLGGNNNTNVQWSVSTENGSILSSGNTYATVQWRTPGTGRIAASSSSACGGSSAQLSILIR